jgi:hypothetical protein
MPVGPDGAAWLRAKIAAPIVLALAGTIVGTLLTQWFTIYSASRKRRDDQNASDVAFRREALEAPCNHDPESLMTAVIKAETELIVAAREYSKEFGLPVIREKR